MQLKSLKDTKNLSNKIAKIIGNDDIIFLYGEIGVGKTTFARFLINNLEAKKGINKSNVLSPTFNIVYDYRIKNIKVLHYDFYRMKSKKDIFQIGLFEDLNKHIKIIEWPELIEPKPKDRIDILFEYSELTNSRTVRICGFGKWKDYKLK